MMKETLLLDVSERRRFPRAKLLSPMEFRHFARSIPRAVRSLNSIRLHQASLADLPSLLKTEEEAWPEESRASKEMLQSRIQVFSEGVVCARVEEKMVGFICTEIIAQPLEEIKEDWFSLTDNGFIEKTHRKNGNTLFGISLSVVPNAPRDTAFALCEAAKKLTIRKKLPWVALGSRLPRYHRFVSKMTPEEFVCATSLRSKRQLDPELDLYKRIGMIPIRILRDYFPDPASCNYGVLLAWKNPFLILSDQLNLWEEHLWFKLWENKMRRRQPPWKI